MEVEITAIYYMINHLTRDSIQLMMQVEIAPPDLLSISSPVLCAQICDIPTPKARKDLIQVSTPDQ